MTPRARPVLTGYPSLVNDSTTGGMTIKWMAPSKRTNSAGNALRMIPAQDLLGCMKVPPLNNHPPFYHATPLVGFSGKLKGNQEEPAQVSAELTSIRKSLWLPAPLSSSNLEKPEGRPWGPLRFTCDPQ